MLTLSLKGNIQIWDADTGQLTARLTDPKNSLQRAHILGQKLVLSPKDQWLFSIEESETRAWDWRTNQLIKKWKFDTKPIFTPDGQTMIHSNSGDVIVSSLRDLHEVKRLKGHLLRAYPQGISLDSKKLVTKSSDGTLKYWDLTKGVLSRNYGAYTHTVVSDDGLTVGLARGDGLLRITETFSSRLLTVIQIGSDYGSKELVLSPHGRYFAYAEITYWHGISDIAILGSRLRVWNTHTGSLLWKKEGVPASRIVFSTNGFTFAGIAQLGANRDFVAFKAFTQTGKIKPLPLPEAKKFREPNTDTVQFIGLHFRQNHFSLVIFVQGRVNQNTDGSGGKTTTRAYLWNLEHSQLEKNIFGNQLCLQIREHTHDEDMLCTLDQFSFTKTQAITWDISKSTWAAKSTSSHFSVLQAVPNGEGYDRTEFFLVETILRHNKWILLRVKKLDLILSEEDSPYISWNRKIWFTKDGRFLISSQSNAVQVYGSIQAGHIFK